MANPAKPVVKILPWGVPLALIGVAFGKFLPDWINDMMATVVVGLIVFVVVVAMWVRHKRRRGDTI